MEERSYSSLGRHGLASSYSYLDGVPFKISSNFRQSPEAVTFPELTRSDISKVLSNEYSFETEEGVLNWARAREAAAKEANLKQQKAKEQREKEKKLQEACVSHNNDTGRNEETQVEGYQISTNMYDIPRKTLQPEEDQNKIAPKPQVLPKHMLKTISEPGTILKPTPIHSSIAKKTNELENNSHFDVSMFESEDDPFDNLELQTINDMEELKVVLDSSAPSNVGGNGQLPSAFNNPSSILPQAVESDSEGFYDVASVIPENTWVKFTDDEPEMKLNCDSQKKSPDQTGAASEVHNSCLQPADSEDGEYFEINNQAALFQNNLINGAHSVLSPTSWPSHGLSSETALGGKLPSHMANSKLFRPVLPPIGIPLDTSGDSTSTVQNPPQSTNPFLQSMGNGYNPFLHNQPNPELGQIDKFSDQPQSLAGFSSDADSLKSAKLIPPPVATKPVLRNRQSGSGARMWSSVGPSLVSSLDESSTKSEIFPGNPYSRHSLSSTDLQLSTSEMAESNRKSPILQNSLPAVPQNPASVPWNRHRPLPPTPSPTMLDNYKSSQLPQNQTAGLSDPYPSLSREAQVFTNSLTSMGFLRARVARAVATFGMDEKEVLDHLIAVDQLVEKKYAPGLVESALHTCKNDTVKAEKFLNMHSQFQELGFQSEQIFKALIATDMHYDKSLDILTA
ncbi:unnamed protein product [Lymnaea stagnalis]|uniref:UMA domain-containing protein n=1 Tax=Lymnaea stagnalis TaxID=6523 RepID=A0AAV2H4Y3_LYMST